MANYCEVFDGSNVASTFSSTYSHRAGGLGFYNGQPTTVGDWQDAGRGKVETLTETGWEAVTDHPK